MLASGTRPEKRFLSSKTLKKGIIVNIHRPHISMLVFPSCNNQGTLVSDILQVEEDGGATGGGHESNGGGHDGGSAVIVVIVVVVVVVVAVDDVASLRGSSGVNAGERAQVVAKL